jgi:hypothetical protein
MTFLLLILGLAGFTASASRWGAESRPEFDERPADDRFGPLS